MDNTCVCCGAIIPEGMMVCPGCEENKKRIYITLGRGCTNTLLRDKFIDDLIKECNEKGIPIHVGGEPPSQSERIKDFEEFLRLHPEFSRNYRTTINF